MDTLWMLVGMVLGAGLYAFGHHMGGAGTVHRLKADVEDELEMLSRQRERFRGRERRAAQGAGEPVVTTNGDQPKPGETRKQFLRRIAFDRGLIGVPHRAPSPPGGE